MISNDQKSIDQYSCIQYQDYAIGGDKIKARAIQFPKYLIVEQVSIPGQNGQ